ncbi:MAG: lipoyl(octanoyl) transferase LipB [Deltaproteobacteria bacterium]|nr:lipoyl(octanoyl) transferase LipB [Deltaproteobacteria bacterium]
MDNHGFEKLVWGKMDYQEALLGMRARHAARVAGECPDALILVEHPPVFTCGKAGGRDNVVLTDEELARDGFGLFHVERAGDVTYHGPGQAIVYPVVDLRARRLGVRGLLEAVAGSISEVVASYGVTAAWDDKNPGVWTSEGRKIAAVGLAIPEKVSMHGLALNVNTNLDHFRLIRACGLEAESTSLARELGRPVDLAEVQERLFASLVRLMVEQGEKA